MNTVGNNWIALVSLFALLLAPQAPQGGDPKRERKGRLLLRDAVISHAIPDLLHADSGIRRRGIARLVQVDPDGPRKQEVAEALVSLASAPDRETREEAIRAFAAWGTRETVPQLVRALSDRNLPRQPIIETLARLGDDRAIPAIADQLNDSGERQAARKALQAIGSRAEPAVLERIDYREVYQVKEVLLTLEVIGTERSFPVIARAAAQIKTYGTSELAEHVARVIAARSDHAPAPEGQPAVLNQNEMDRLLGDLRSPNRDAQRQAADRLAQVAPIERRRAEVARALEAAAVSRSPFLGPPAAIRALVVWGTPETVPVLVGILEKPQSDEAFRAALRAAATAQFRDPRVAEAVVKYVDHQTYWQEAVNTLKEMAAAGEHGALRCFGSRRSSAQARSQALEILKVVGTEACIPPLLPYILAGSYGAVGRETFDAILARCGKTESEVVLAAKRAQLAEAGRVDKEQVAQALASLRRPESDQRRAGAGYFAKMKPSDPNREIADALETAAKDPDVNTRIPAAEALGRWGDHQSVALLVELVRQDPAVRSYATRSLGLLRDARGADVLVEFLPQDRGTATSALQAMGPPAEKATASLLESDDGSVRQAGFDVLETIGTEESVSALRAAAGRYDPTTAERVYQVIRIIRARSHRLPWRAADAKGTPRSIKESDLAEASNDLRTSDPSARRRAVDLFTKTAASHRPKDIGDSLERLLDDPDHFLRVAAADALGLWGGRQSVPALIRQLAKDDMLMRGHAMWALARIDDPRAAEAIAARLGRDGTEPTEVLKVIGPAAEDAVADRLQDREWLARLYAAYVLKVIGTPRSVPALEFATQDDKGQTRNAAQQAIDAIAGRAAAR